jgi:hypothetical protein
MKAQRWLLFSSQLPRDLCINVGAQRLEGLPLINVIQFSHGPRGDYYVCQTAVYKRPGRRHVAIDGWEEEEKE